jgi:hypothetical protein
VRFFRAALRRAARPDRAKAEKAYLKSELRFFGAGQPAIRAAVLEYCRQHSDLTPRDLRAIAEALYETEVHELRSAAIGVLGAVVRGLDRRESWGEGDRACGMQPS